MPLVPLGYRGRHGDRGGVSLRAALPPRRAGIRYGVGYRGRPGRGADTGGGIPPRQPPPRVRKRSPRNRFFFRRIPQYHPPMFRDLPITARELKATPAMLERIYEGAKLGLRGDSLALAAGMLPVELARLKLMDPIAEIAEMKGRADSEMTMSRTLYEAAEAGDSKAALEFLRHRHEWQAAQRIQVDVAQSISITAALEMAEKRVKAAEVIEDAVEVVKPLARPQALADELGVV